MDRQLDAGPLADFKEEELAALACAACNAVARAETAAVEQGSSEHPADVLGDLCHSDFK